MVMNVGEDGFIELDVANDEIWHDEFDVLYNFALSLTEQLKLNLEMLGSSLGTR
jgi:hypothetical protein